MTLSENNPAYNTNPPQLYAQWVNVVTGEMFICLDNTRDANVWKGQQGTTIGPTP